jgi:RimJ/RimL family protein N-acetyltransferase
MTSEAHIGAQDLVLETARLRLRRFRREDVDSVFAINGDPVAMKYYPRNFERRDAEEWVERNLRRYAEHGYGLFAITLKDAEEMIGDCGIIQQVIGGETQLEVGYHLRRDLWGHGYATEAARVCMELAFRDLGAEKVISLIRPENVPSRRVAERNGLKIERQIVHWDLTHLVYAISREEFAKTLPYDSRRESQNGATGI